MTKHILDLIIFNSEIGLKHSLELNLERGADPHKMTIGVDFIVISTYILGHELSIRLWDTSGERHFKDLMVDYCRGKSGAIIFFDISSYDTFRDIPEYVEIIRKRNEPIEIMLIGVKFVKDSADEFHREVGNDIITDYMKEANINAYFEITARNSINFYNPIMFLTSLCLRISGHFSDLEFNTVLEEIMYKAEYKE